MNEPLDLRGCIELALSFVPSKPMRGCWRDFIPAHRSPLEKCVDIICGAYAGIGKKLCAIGRIAEAFPEDAYPRLAIEIAECALRERGNVSGDVFETILERSKDYDERHENNSDGEAMTHTFNGALKSAGKFAAIYRETHGDVSGFVRFTVDKFVAGADADDELRWVFRWELNSDAEIVYFKHGLDCRCETCKPDRNDDSEERLNEWSVRHAWEGGDHPLRYMPVPFDYGDIITIDMRPYINPFHGVIVSMLDGEWALDCCAVSAAYMKDGKITSSALKHNFGEDEAVSCLFKAEVYTGELPENEQPLAAIAEEIKTAENSREKAEEIYRRL